VINRLSPRSEFVAVPDQQCTAPQELRAALHPAIALVVKIAADDAVPVKKRRRVSGPPFRVKMVIWPPPSNHGGGCLRCLTGAQQSCDGPMTRRPRPAADAKRFRPSKGASVQNAGPEAAIHARRSHNSMFAHVFS
jgi:hypothetical protein